MVDKEKIRYKFKETRRNKKKQQQNNEKTEYKPDEAPENT